MKKRITSLAISLILAFSAATPIFAETATEQAIKAVRQCFDIPEELQKVDFNTYNNGDRQQIRVSWTDEEDNAAFSATLDEHQCINNVDYYDYSDEEELNDKNAKLLKKNDAYALAENQLQTLYGTKIAGCFKADKRVNISTERIHVYYNYYKNNIIVPECSVSLTYNRNNGMLARFSGPCKDKLNADYPAPNGIITDSSRIFESYAGSDENVLLCYQLFNDIKTDTQTVKPVYEITPAYIDAFNGDRLKDDSVISPAFYDKEVATENAAEDSASGMDFGYRLTPYEQQAVDDFSKLITAEKGDSIAKKYFPALKGMEVESSDILKYKLAGNSYSVLSISYEADKKYGYLSMNAENGEIIGLYVNTVNNDIIKQADKVTTEQQAKDIADSLVKQIATKEYNSKNYTINCNSPDYENGSFFVAYERTYNNVPVVGQNIRVGIDKKTGNVIQYGKSWDKLTFPSLDGILSAKDAFEQAKQYDFGLKYIFVNEKPRLVYGFNSESANTMVFDAKSGERLNWYGMPYKSDVKGEYTDLDGCQYKDIITELADYGYCLEGTEFKPDENITIKDFYSFMGLGTEFYDVVKISGYSDSPINIFTDKQAERAMTKYDLAKIYVHTNGQYQIAENGEIFVKAYNDVDDENNGFVAVCTALGYIPKQGDDFNGKQTITRGEAAKYLYDYLTARNYI